MKLGILGTGMIVQDLLLILGETGFDSVSILGTERSRARTEELAEKYGLMRCWFHYDGMLSSDVDTVYIGLPNSLHVSFAHRALEAGKNVIVEKPAAAYLAELQELRRLAEKKNLILLEAMNVHYLPAYLSLKKELPSVGQVRVVSLNFSQYSSRYDAFLAGDTPPVFDPQKEGGALMDINVYNLHFAVGLFGKPKSVQYYANIQRGIDTSGVMVLDYGAFKAVCVGGKDCQSSVGSSIQGEKGQLIVPVSANQMTGYIFAGSRGGSVTREFSKDHHLFCEFREFHRILTERDMEKVSAMLDISETVAAILEEGRKQAGLVFPKAFCADSELAAEAERGVSRNACELCGRGVDKIP